MLYDGGPRVVRPGETGRSTMRGFPRCNGTFAVVPESDRPGGGGGGVTVAMRRLVSHRNRSHASVDHDQQLIDKVVTLSAGAAS